MIWVEDLREVPYIIFASQLFVDGIDYENTHHLLKKSLTSE